MKHIRSIYAVARTYEGMKGRWEEIVPLRGRSIDTRPIGKRRDSDEMIVQVLLPDGGHAYVARLRKTDVVTYMPDGDVLLNVGGWDTKSTVDFMSMWCPRTVAVSRRLGNMWAELRSCNFAYAGDAYAVIPLLNCDPVRFRQRSTGDYPEYELVTPLKIYQDVIDRKKMSEARKTIAAFITYGTTMLKLCDGVLENDVVMSHPRELLGVWHELARSNDVEDHNALLMAIVRQYAGHMWGHRTNAKYWYEAKDFKSRIDRMLKAGEGPVTVWKTKVVDTSCYRDNVVVSLA